MNSYFPQLAEGPRAAPAVPHRARPVGLAEPTRRPRPEHPGRPNAIRNELPAAIAADLSASAVVGYELVRRTQSPPASRSGGGNAPGASLEAHFDSSPVALSVAIACLRVEYVPSDFALDATLAELGKLVAPQLEGEGLTYELRACGAAVRADADKLREILVNLFSNAIKFTPSGGRIAVARALSADGPPVVPYRGARR
jgi:hypothetical protein